MIIFVDNKFPSGMISKDIPGGKYRGIYPFVISKESLLFQ